MCFMSENVYESKCEGQKIETLIGRRHVSKVCLHGTKNNWFHF